MNATTDFFSQIPSLGTGDVILKRVTVRDTDPLAIMTGNPHVYRYLPTFLFEKKYEDMEYVIDHLYDECINESYIQGIYENGRFCGLAEMYGYRPEIQKISLGYRLMEECWGRGIATKALGLMVDYLYNETDIQIITASTMLDNRASARVLEKNGFEMVSHASLEDWGFKEPTPADKWIR